jgi:hypothetical protein
MIGPAAETRVWLASGVMDIQHLCMQRSGLHYPFRYRGKDRMGSSRRC